MMKNWQRGFELDYLKEMEDHWERYNSYSESPFSAMKKNTIAESLHKGSLVEYCKNGVPVVRFDRKIAKARSAIKMYGNVEIGTKEQGDATITKLAWVPGEEKQATEVLSSYVDPTWLMVWAEDDIACQIAEDAGFKWVGTKITTFAELYAVYFKEAQRESLFPHEDRVHPTRMAIEDCALEETTIAGIDSEIASLLEELDNLDLDFTNHYSNYNKSKAWSALSLRGYSPDPAFITKPAEMNKKWNEEHKNEAFAMQDTELRAKLPAVEKLLKLLPGEHHRIRLMQLSPGGGELERHTDQVDPDAGVENGNVMRFHFPLITNDAVVFTMWGVDGKPKSANMKVGECWYLDTRKPHTAINNGTEARIHLVIDVEANDDVRDLVKGNENV